MTFFIFTFVECLMGIFLCYKIDQFLCFIFKNCPVPYCLSVNQPQMRIFDKLFSKIININLPFYQA